MKKSTIWILVGIMALILPLLTLGINSQKIIYHGGDQEISEYGWPLAFVEDDYINSFGTMDTYYSILFSKYALNTIFYLCLLTIFASIYQKKRIDNTTFTSYNSV